MPGLWVLLPAQWDIGNVRAVLTLLITLFCTVGIWVVSHVCWKLGARETGTKTGKSTKLLSLFSVSGLGDVVDIIPLLRRDLGAGLRTKLVLQSLAVSLLSTVAILSGPIARYSTRSSSEVRTTPLSGWMATSNFGSMSSAQVKWNNTIERLNSAGFPLNQLLDFLPDVHADWKYDESQWNSSWTADCQWTNETAIELEAVGDYTDGILDHIPGIASVLPRISLTPAHNLTYEFSGAYVDEIYKDILLFVVVQSNPDVAYQDEPNIAETGRQANYLPFDFTIAAFHLRNAPAVTTDFRNIVIGTGPIEQALYTMADCKISRVPSRTPQNLDEDTDWHVAFPWTTDIWALPTVFSEFSRSTLMEGSFTGGNVTLPSGPELFRFYQAYLVSKDTEFHETVTRPINVVVPTTELLVPVLAILCLYVCVLCVALAWSWLLKVPGEECIPKTKVEWMMQVVKEVAGRDVSAEFFGATWGQLRAPLRAAVSGESRVLLGEPTKEST